MHGLARKSWGFCFLGALLLWSVAAFAGSYLDRTALLVSQATRESDVLAKRLSDKELARMVQRLCEGRLTAAQSMMVPKEVHNAHPHLILMLEQYERAADAAANGDAAAFLTLQRRARDEEQVLRSILKQLGWTLPDV